VDLEFGEAAVTDKRKVPPLKRSMRVAGVLLLTLSAVTPASSVFVIVPGVIAQAGSGALLSMIAAALLAGPIAYVYAELSSAYPIAGGEYCMVARTVGHGPGFAVLGLTIAGNMLAPAVLALGASEYLAVVLPGLNQVTVAIAIIAATTLMGILHIRTNAWVTGFFLLLELLALAVLTALGFWNAQNSLWEIVVHPVVVSEGASQATPLAMIGLATTVGIFAYNGYGAAVYFAEEMHEAPRGVARTVLWALVITVITELLPVTAVLMGAPDLNALLGSQNPFGDFVAATGGQALNIAISLAVAIAILNAVLACLLQNARFFYSTGRDFAWHPRINNAFMATHEDFHSPWIATLAAGAFSVAACFLGLQWLLVATGTSIALVYTAICVAAIAGRRSGATNHAAYRMPLYPFWPVLSLIALAYVFYTSVLDPSVGRPSLITNAIIIVVSLAYYAFVHWRKGGWTLRGPDEETPGAR
jgi:amino acid transporter